MTAQLTRPPAYMTGGAYPYGLLNPTPSSGRSGLSGLLVRRGGAAGNGGGGGGEGGGGEPLNSRLRDLLAPMPTLPSGAAGSGQSASMPRWLPGLLLAGATGGVGGVASSLFGRGMQALMSRYGYTPSTRGQTPTLTGTPMAASGGQWAANAAGNQIEPPQADYSYGSDLTGSTRGGINIGPGGIGNYGGYGGSNWLTGNTDGFGAFGGGWGRGWDSFGAGLSQGFTRGPGGSWYPLPLQNR